jgi:hypothetical protein
MPSFQPLISSPSETTDSHRRRASDSALYYWDWLRGDRPFPCSDEIDPLLVPGLWGHVFFIDFGDDLSERIFAYASPTMKQVCGGDPTGQPLAECFPESMRDDMLLFFEVASMMKQPVTQANECRADGENMILYRVATMPISDDQVDVNGLFGVFNYKVVGHA